jgi:hypothetical protein
MAGYFCDPAWHNGMTDFTAVFLILPIPEERMFHTKAYATCELHAGRALRIMLEDLKTVTVHEVNKE